MKQFALFVVITLAIAAWSCGNEFINPYDQIEELPADSTDVADLDPTSLVGLHAVIFRPTCANSGCHDGTFEPDFRTVNSTYNTLVGHSIIKNDPQNSFAHRVVPGDPDASQLLARLTYDIDGNSGIMPLATEPGSDYPENREEYIERIRAWIANGAQR